jgi:hypothetical protein
MIVFRSKLIPSGGFNGTGVTAAIALCINEVPADVHRRIQAFMADPVNKHRLQSLSQMPEGGWDWLATSPITGWNTDCRHFVDAKISLLWVASHALEKEIYFFDYYGGLRVFSPIILPGLNYKTYKTLTVDQSVDTDWSSVVRNGSVVLASNHWNFYSMLLRATPHSAVKQ